MSRMAALGISTFQGSSASTGVLPAAIAASILAHAAAVSSSFRAATRSSWARGVSSVSPREISTMPVSRMRWMASG